MEHLAKRCATVAAGAVAVGGLVGILTSISPSLPDVQIGDVDLAAASIDVSPAIDVVENHVRPDFAGGGADDQQIDLGALLLGNGDDGLGAGSTFAGGDLDQSVVDVLTGGSLDPQALPLGLPFTPDLGGLGVPAGGSLGGGAEQAVNSAAADAVTNLGIILQGLPDPQQTMTNAVIAMETGFNAALVAAQQAAAERLFGDNPDVNDAVNWIFSLNNTVLAQNEDAFNSMLGISFNAQDSLLGHFDPSIIDTDWTTMLGFSPDQFNDIVSAIQADNLWLLLSGIDWDGLFDGLF